MARDSVVVVVDLRDHIPLGSLFPILPDAPFMNLGFALFWAFSWLGSYPKCRCWEVAYVVWKSWCVASTCLTSLNLSSCIRYKSTKNSRMSVHSSAEWGVAKIVLVCTITKRCTSENAKKTTLLGLHWKHLIYQQDQLDLGERSEAVHKATALTPGNLKSSMP